jgi:putative ABC transport system permease protein
MHDWRAAVRARLEARRVDSTKHVAVVEELAQHLDDRYHSLLARGHDEAAAARSVLQELDEGDALRDELWRAERSATDRPVPGTPPGRMGRALWQDLRYAARALRWSPGFTLIATLTLALGIGVNAAIFSVINAVMLRPLPYADPARLIRLYESNRQRGWPEFSASHPNFLDWRAQTRSWESLAATSAGTISMTTAAGAEVLREAVVTADFLPTLGITPSLGRNFLADEDRVGGNTRVVILTDGFWRRAFGANPAIVGAIVQLNGTPYTIVGVLPPQFQWGPDLEVLVPLAPDPARSRSDHRLLVIGRLKPGVSLDEARTELTAVAARLAQQYPADNEGWTVRLVTFYDWLIPAPTRQSLVVLQGAVLLVLLIACVNVANLLLARGAARQKELAIRVAIGASRGRIVWHGAMEALILAGLGAAAGLGVAAAALRVLSTYAASAVPRLDEARVDARVLAFAALSALAAAVLSGVLPSIHAARDHGGQVLHDATRGSTGGRGRRRLRATLTVAEVALSVALLIGAGLLLRSFVNLQQVDPGFAVDGLMTGRVMLTSRTAFDTPDKRSVFWRRLTDEVRGLPGITAFSTGSGVPLTPGNTSTEIEVPGVQLAPGAQPSADWRIVTPGYFATMGIPLRGSDFPDSDGPGSRPSIIISETLARTYWPGQDPIGRTLITRSLNTVPHTIIGVAGDVRGSRLDSDPRPMLYYSGIAVPSFNPMYAVWRSASDPATQVAAIRQTITRINPQVALYGVTAATALRSDSFGPRRLNLYLLGIFAAVALALALIGLSGVMAYLVSQRTREIGVRLALGANRRDIFASVVGQGVGMAIAGAAIGVGGAFWLTRVMSSLLFSVSATDPGTFVGVPILLVAIAALACAVPARRATRIDPVVALRAD